MIEEADDLQEIGAVREREGEALTCLLEITGVEEELAVKRRRIKDHPEDLDLGLGIKRLNLKHHPSKRNFCNLPKVEEEEREIMVLKGSLMSSLWPPWQVLEMQGMPIGSPSVETKTGSHGRRKMTEIQINYLHPGTETDQLLVIEIAEEDLPVQ